MFAAQGRECPYFALSCIQMKTSEKNVPLVLFIYMLCLNFLNPKITPIIMNYRMITACDHSNDHYWAVFIWLCEVVLYASVNSTCAQPPPPATAGHLPALSVRGGLGAGGID